MLAFTNLIHSPFHEFWPLMELLFQYKRPFLGHRAGARPQHCVTERVRGNPRERCRAGWSSATDSCQVSASQPWIPEGTWGYSTEPNHLLQLNPSFCRDQYQPAHSPYEWSLYLILLPKHKELSSVSHWARKWGSFNSLCFCRKCFSADGKSTSTHNPRQASKNDEDNILLAANTKT